MEVKDASQSSSKSSLQIDKESPTHQTVINSRGLSKSPCCHQATVKRWIDSHQQFGRPTVMIAAVPRAMKTVIQINRRDGGKYRIQLDQYNQGLIMFTTRW